MVWKHLILIACCSTHSLFAQMDDKLISAIRNPNETFESAKKRNLNMYPSKVVDTSETAMDGDVALELLNTNDIPQWDNMSQVNEAFRKLRDVRFVDWASNEVVGGRMLRRSSWMYPDDGCFIRAELAKTNLKQWGFPAVKKLFVFGTLEVKTSNHPSGKVKWWYHVVPVIKMEQDVLVFDPAINPAQPLKIDEWANSMNKVNDLTFSICEEDTVSPMQICDDVEPTQYDTVIQSQNMYLDAEWNRSKRLGHVPEMILGSTPPWNQNLPQ